MTNLSPLNPPSGAARRRRFAGFTLIELLIVVAIIAILAAIAVPNFIDAQTRSKVARVLSDLRTMRTAVESYAVDNQKPARMAWGCVWDDEEQYRGQWQEVYGTLVSGPRSDPAGSSNYTHMGGGVTSPIAYITTLPTDPFDAGRQTGAHWKLYTYFEVSTMQWLQENNRATGYCPVPNLPGYVYVPPGPAELQRFKNRLGQYVLWSVGPSGLEGLATTNFFVQYDPTNGTTSPGAVFVSQRFFAPQYVNPNGL